jgi:protoporphyrinogen oxidase
MGVVILGAGPAGLAAAFALAKQGQKPIVLERSHAVGGMCKTIEHNGYLFDIGGHRFFTKFDEVQELWEEILGDQLLLRPRLSRIFYNGKFFDYPLKATNALRNLGLVESTRCMASYARARLRGRGQEDSFEEWVSNRFGNRLFDIFFRSYTEKVWGIPTHEIGAEWAAQRIKNMELSTAVIDALRRPLERVLGSRTDVASLIEEFHYPRTGPGLMYETMAQKLVELGGEIRFGHTVVGLVHDGSQVSAVRVESNGETHEMPAEHVLSSIPLTLLVRGMEPPAKVLEATQQLRYRNLLTVNLIADAPDLFPDNWIYVHDPKIQLGRIQNYKNWSPHMVPDSSKTSLGLEYFCSDDEPLWTMSDEELLALGQREMNSIELLKGAPIIDGCVVRVPKAYPVYKRGYEAHLNVIKDYIDGFSNLAPMGRYGMFKYNNSDHSILTALLSVENILGAKHNVWAVNTETEYHEVRG